MDSFEGRTDANNRRHAIEEVNGGFNVKLVSFGVDRNVFCQMESALFFITVPKNK